MRFFLSLVFGLVLPCVAHAHLVVIDPANYKGTYVIQRYDSVVSKPGTNTFDLAEGEYTFSIGPSNGFLFKVDGEGLVTTLNPNAAIVEDGNVLKLQTRQVFISVGEFEGKFRVRNVEGEDDGDYFAGSRPVTLVNGMGAYILDLAPSNNFRFGLNQSGHLVLENSANATINDGRDALTFNTQKIRVVPNGYAGTFRVRNVTPDKLPKLYETVNVVPGVKGYIFYISPAEGAAFRFDVSDAGEVNVAANVAAAKGVGRTIELQTSSLTISPQAYQGAWYVLHNSKVPLKGVSDVVVLKGLGNYGVEVVPGSTGFFGVDGDGNPTESQVTVLDKESKEQNFKIAKKVTQEYDCLFGAEIVTFERIGSLKANSRLEWTAKIHVHSPKYFGPNQVHYAWDGQMAVTHEASGEAIVSRSGQLTILNDTPVGGDSINFAMDGAGGSLGGEFLTNTHVPLSLYLNGNLLNSAAFQLDYGTWNKLDTRRRINMPFQNTGKGGRIDNVEPVKGMCTAR